MKKNILFFLFFLGGCSTNPNHPVLDDCVNRSYQNYCINGVWYSPQKHYDYDAEGLASWYGDADHGKPKATGEIFNHHAFSAAHKELPLPSIVEVTNLKNDRSVVLLVDDRGPFIPGRIIDLSKAAAKHLGFYQTGTAPVRVKCLAPESQEFAKLLRKYGRRGIDPSGRDWHHHYNHYKRMKNI